jgi:hypothetical protein
MKTLRLQSYYRNSTGDYPIQTLPAENLAPGNEIPLTFETKTYDPLNLAKGNYTIWAYAWSVPYETDIEDSTLVCEGTVAVKIPDVNQDGMVELMGFHSLCQAYGSRPDDPDCDVYLDLCVELMGFSILYKYFGAQDP